MLRFFEESLRSKKQPGRLVRPQRGLSQKTGRDEHPPRKGAFGKLYDSAAGKSIASKETQRGSLRSRKPRNAGFRVWLNAKSCPTGEISQLQKPEPETDRSRMLQLREISNLAHGRTERRRVEITRSISRALARVGVRRTAQNTRRKDVPVARHKTRRLHVARRAGCAPEDAPVARRKTRRLHARRRAACTPEDVPLATARRAGCAPFETRR